MPGKTIIYGEILDEKKRKEIGRAFPQNEDSLKWRTETKLFKSTDQASTVFVDLDDPKFAESEFLASLATAGANIKIIGKSKNPNLDQAMRVSKLGVAEILTPDECFDRLCKLLEKREDKHKGKNDKLVKFSADKLIGASPQIREIRKTINLLADVDFPSALILGETGTGKSFISKILHSTGVRAAHNLVEVNCSAIPDELFESELFGHVKGAFTDARSEKIGLFEHAENGTLFLDEIGSLSSTSQAKILKIIEDKKLRRVGDVSEKDINVRVVAATNLDFEKAIESGRFREDLYFRLNLLVIEIPPLRERLEDLEPLFEHYLNYYASLYGIPEIRFTDAAIGAMRKHYWPGNVRELCNVIERAVLLTKSDTIDIKDVRTAFQKGRVSLKERQQLIVDIPDQGITLPQIEQAIIKQVLDMFDWNKSEAAKFLGISRPRLRRILNNSGVEQNRRKK